MLLCPRCQDLVVFIKGTTVSDYLRVFCVFEGEVQIMLLISRRQTKSFISKKNGPRIFVFSAADEFNSGLSKLG